MRSRLRRNLLIAGIFLGGGAAGALLFAVATSYSLLTLSSELTIADLMEVLVALFLAVYIPLAIDAYRDKRKYSRDILVEQVQGFMGLLKEVNAVLLECARSGSTEESHRMRIKAAFITANLKVQAT